MASQTVRQAALNLLARREHSRRELAQKLGRRFDSADIGQALDALEEGGLLCDFRFAAHYARWRAPKMGALKIRDELRKRGVAGEHIDSALAAVEEGETERAAAALAAKFGDEAIEGKALLRAARFLQSRGFLDEDIARAVGLHNRGKGGGVADIPPTWSG